jgi:hypothetical protein
MFQLKDATKAKLHKTDDKGIKVGQKDLKPAVIVNLAVVLPNTALEMFDPSLRAILYGKGSPGEKQRKQSELEGLDMVQDLPSLTKTGQYLGTLAWGEEQSGCVLTLDYGLGDERANIVLKDATTKDYKLRLSEGGALKVSFRVHAPVEHLTAEQIGRLHLMHQRDVTIALVGPQVDQADIEDEDDLAPKGATVTPIQALAAAQQRSANAEGKKTAAA